METKTLSTLITIIQIAFLAMLGYMVFDFFFVRPITIRNIVRFSTIAVIVTAYVIGVQMVKRYINQEEE